MCTFGVLGRSCETPAAPKPPRLHMTASEPNRAPTLQSHHPEREKERKWEQEREKKRENLGLSFLSEKKMLAIPATKSLFVLHGGWGRLTKKARHVIVPTYQWPKIAGKTGTNLPVSLGVCVSLSFCKLAAHQRWVGPWDECDFSRSFPLSIFSLSEGQTGMQRLGEFLCWALVNTLGVLILRVQRPSLQIA